MKIVIPVAGYGTRLKPHTEKIQKVLLPVAGKTVLDHIVENLFDFGLNRISFIIGHLGEQIVKHMARYTGEFAFIEQTERLGLGHAVLQGLENVDEPVLVHLGDAVYKYQFSTLESLNVNGIAVLPVADPTRFGVVETRGDRIIGFHEKVADPPSNLAIIGLYYFRSEARLKQAIEYLIQNDLRTKGEYQITDAMEIMLKWGEPFKVLTSAKWYDAGVPETYLETNRLLLETSHDEYSSVEFREPVFVGKNCSIRNSVIGPYVTIMEGCDITDCQIEDCIVLENSKLEKVRISSRIVAGDGSRFC